jgi:hypothetical protein
MKDFDHLCAIQKGAQGRLMAIPGVHAVGIGSKIVDGQLTSEPAIMVFVVRKKPMHELPPNHVIPAEIDGVKTDVYETEIPRTTATDTRRYRPLVGGSLIRPGGYTEEKVTTNAPPFRHKLHRAKDWEATGHSGASSSPGPR